jgi:hypothetical protein
MTDLTALVLELRHELHVELPIRLHQRTPEVLKRTDDDPEKSFGHSIGMPFTAAMLRRLSHRDWWGINELAASSIGEVGDYCRARHASDLHRSPGRSTSLCERIVSALCEFGQPIAHVAWREGLDEETTYALAIQGLRHAASWRHRQLHRYMRTARERERDGRVECPLCIGRVVVMRRGRAA